MTGFPSLLLDDSRGVETPRRRNRTSEGVLSTISLPNTVYVTKIFSVNLKVTTSIEGDGFTYPTSLKFVSNFQSYRIHTQVQDINNRHGGNLLDLRDCQKMDIIPSFNKRENFKNSLINFIT